MTTDTGFAPNPFHGITTLATCKWQIRKIKKIIENENLYLAGFTSKKLCNEEVGSERLIYIMKVTEKLLFKDYFIDPRFNCKKPSLENESLITRVGDNIYEPTEHPEVFIQLENYQHDCGNMEEDLKGEYVLISDYFYYFGLGAIAIDNLGINIPRYQTGHGVKTENCEKLLDYLRKYFTNNIIINSPHKWNENEPYTQ